MDNESPHYKCTEHSKTNSVLEDLKEINKSLMESFKEFKDFQRETLDFLREQRELNKMTEKEISYIKKKISQIIPIATLILGFFGKDLMEAGVFTKILGSIFGVDVPM
jgi:uncharacterized protein YoxC